MKPKLEAKWRIARRAYAGAGSLPVPERIQLFEDLALILPEKEAQACRDTAFTLREAEKQQRDLFEIFK